MTDHLKVACIGDLQLPYGDDRAIALWFQMMKWWKPTNIIFTGDIDDQLEYSSFSDGTTDEFFNQVKAEQKDYEKAYDLFTKNVDKAIWDEDLEKYNALKPPSPVPDGPLPFIKKNAESARNFYTEVHAAHKKADKFSCLGNHDIRIYKYLDRKAPETLDTVNPPWLYDFDNLGIDYMMYSDKPRELFPGVFFHHGNTVSSSGAAVRADIDNYGVSLVRGHDHAGAVIYKSFPLANKNLFGLACGHMCDPNLYGLQYTINPAWELGFGILHIYGNEVHPQFIHIKPDYTAVLDGKLFQG
jgi:hypothetical protein